MGDDRRFMVVMKDGNYLRVEGYFTPDRRKAFEYSNMAQARRDAERKGGTVEHG